MMREVAMVSIFLLSAALVDGAENVRAELSKTTAWTGEPVTLVVTLYSPGPFQGTASFDLPELPRTVFLKSGSPLVGSEDVDGESYITQRHELNVITQVTGELVIPSFLIRFEGKMTFVGEAVPMEGKTPELRLNVKRPPGTDDLPMVVVASDMKVMQSWQPEDKIELSAGDVVRRTITRQASGTSAMFFSPLKPPAIDGVRLYDVPPIVQDRSERGESTAQRTDTLKYQFETAGTYSLPSITFTWWDPEAEKLQSEEIEGRKFTVTGNERSVSASAESKQPKTSIWWRVVIVLLILDFASFIVWQVWKAWRLRYHSVESIAARRVNTATRADDAKAAYTAFLDWRRVIDAVDATDSAAAVIDSSQEFQEEWRKLSASIFSDSAAGQSWDSQRFRAAFIKLRREAARSRKLRESRVALAQLNPR